MPEAHPSLPVSRLGAAGPWVLWGGALPSGSLKYLTFSKLLERHPPGSVGLCEISGGSSALALEHLGRERGLPCIALTDSAGAEHLRARGFRGETLAVTHLPEAFARAAQLERDGWTWTHQFTSPIFIDCVRSWASELLPHCAQRGIDRVLCGFGTGATAIGLTQSLRPHGVQVVAYEPPSGHGLPGWRTYATQNLGPDDLFAPYAHEVERRVCRSGTPTLNPLMALLHQVADHPPGRTLLVAHEASPDAPGPLAV